MKLYALMFLYFGLWVGASAEQCGQQGGGAVCPNGLCCSQYGWCGSTDPYCGVGCQSQCGPSGGTPTPTNPTPVPDPSGGGGGDISSIISSDVFDQMLKHRNDPQCPSHGFYSYNAFLDAARFFGGFGTTGDDNTRKRELAAFLAQTSHETTGGWTNAPDGPYAWGYCFITQLNTQDTFCQPDPRWPCAPDQKYYGRGPIQLTSNYNYGQAGSALGFNLLQNPDLVATDATVSFKTAIWFWMTPQANKPSSHDVIIGSWQPSNGDINAGRVSGYGVITNIINGIECGQGPNVGNTDRIGFYKKYCDILGINPGENLDCTQQQPFA